MAIDGLHTIDSYLNHTEGIGPNNLTDFSVCLRFNVNYLKPELSTLLSYSTFLSDNMLFVVLMKESGGSLLLVASRCYNCKLEQVSKALNGGGVKKPNVVHMVCEWPPIQLYMIQPILNLITKIRILKSN